MSFLDYLCDVTECTPLPGYKLKVACSDGAKGIFDMSGYVNRGMYKPLKDVRVFQQVHIVSGAPTWPGNIDIAPERVRSDMTPMQ